jgi:uncharacterized OB-fold protein
MERAGVRYPRMTIDSQPYWEGCRVHELRYQICSDCGEVVFHARAACPYCLSEALRWERSAGKGAVYSFAIQQLPVDREHPGKVPLTLGIVQLDEGFHMFTEIDSTDRNVLKIGARVSVYFDRVADDLVLPKFRLDGPALDVPAGGAQ